MVPNSSARLLTMPLSWLASSGVSWPSATLLRRSVRTSAQSWAVFSGRRGKWIGAPRREGIAGLLRPARFRSLGRGGFDLGLRGRLFRGSFIGFLAGTKLLD